MRTPEITKEKILKHSGRLFNTQGYKATSLSDITTSTGLTKGAIYRHFKNKEVLEGETLMHLSQIMFTNVKARIKSKTTAPAKLRAIFHYFESYISHPPVTGGCPLMNAAIESDDTDPLLRRKAIFILDILRDSVVTILNNGIRHHQLKPGINKEYYSTVIIASLEGAIMMSKLRGNNNDIRRVVQHLERTVTEIEV
jgi:TetR/AcrR family transcriptional regulator, transcriptional repressor for nem operon